MISHRLQCGCVRCSRAVSGRRYAFWTAALLAGFVLGVAGNAGAQMLTPDNVFASAYHVPNLNNEVVAETRANAFTILTNGIVDHGTVDNVDTWNSDDLGVTLDFVGLEYATPSQFDFIQIELGNQFGDGGDWEAMPNIYVLKNPTLVGDTVEPNMSPNWVQLPTASIVETTGHVFDPIVVPGPGGTMRFDLTGIPAADRTGWGWAVGGVDGNQNAEDIFHFISVTEVSAEGQANMPVPAVPTPTTLAPANVVSNSYNSVGRSGDGLIHAAAHVRGQSFASVTNGLLDSVVGLGGDGFDTFEGDAAGALTDFAGLQYSSINRFDSITIELGNQFVDGGDWDETPRIFILKNPVDTNTTRPEDDPTNWREITGAVETTGHVFSPLTIGPDAAGGTINFDLTSIPEEERTGWGWAVGGVDGNANAEGVVNFISVTELDATGAVIPRPYDLTLEVRSNGEVRMVNETQFDLDIDFYEVTSDGEALDMANWNSLGDGTANPGTHNPADFPVGTGDGDGWEELGNLDDSIVAEGYLQGSSILEAGQHVSLGNLYDGPEEDLSFRYRLAGGVFINGLVEFITSEGLPGDYNNDGKVDAADYTAWRDNVGAPAGTLPNDSDGGVIGQAQYDTWKANFGMMSGAGAGAAVPEPSSWVLLFVVSVGGWLLRRRA